MNPTRPDPAASRSLGFGSYVLVWSAALLSGVLLDLGASDSERSALMFVALVPLFIALILTRREPLLIRLAIGFVTGILFSAGILREDLAAAWLGFGWTPEVDVASFGEIAALAIALALTWALFGLAAGPLLAVRSTALAFVGTCSLWVGIEFAIQSWLPESFSCLVLGSVLPPDSALGQNADLAGVPGLSFLIVAQNTALLIFFSRTGAWSRLWPLAAVTLVGAALIARGAPRQDDEVSTSPPCEIALIKMDSASSPTLQGFLRHLGGRPNRDDGRAKIVLSAALKTALPEGLSEALPAGTFFVAGTDWRAGTFPGPAATAAVLGPATPRGEGGGDRRIVDFAFPGVSSAKLGLLTGSSARRPDAFRVLTREGAGVLAVSERRTRPLSTRQENRKLRALAYRAVENRRWIAYSSAWGRAATFDPRGRRFDQVLPSVEAAIWTSVHFAKRQSPFTRRGWLLGPLCLAAALGVLGALLVRSARRPRKRFAHRLRNDPP